VIKNPVLMKELRDRVRTWRSPFLITFYLGILVIIGGFFLYERTMYGYAGPRALRMGMEIFNLMAVLQLLLIGFLTPGMTAGVISGERERQTLPLLMITRMSPLSVTVGKLLSAISYILLLVVLSLPLYSIVFFFGNISMREFLQAAGIYLVTTLTLGSIGIFFSSFFRRTTVAVVFSYGITFFLFAGTFFVAQMIRQIQQYASYAQGPVDVPFIIYFNPLVALGSGLPMGQNFLPFPGGMFPIKALAPWQVNLLLDAVIIIVAVGLATWLIHPLRAGTRKKG